MTFSLPTAAAVSPGPGSGEPSTDDLRRENAFLREVLGALPVGLIVVDADDRVYLANRLAEEIRGVGHRVGQPLAGCHPGRSRRALEVVLGRLREVESRERHPVVVDRGNGWQVLYSRVTSGSGEYRGAVWLAHDIRRQKELQRQLLHQERIGSLGRMAARLAHEVKNSLNIVSGALHNLRRPRVSDEDREMLGIISGQVDRLTQLMDHLREVSRPMPFEPRPCDVPALLREIVREMACRHATPIRLAAPPRLPPLSVDVTLIRRLVVNALDNAAWASGPDGEVVLSVKVETEPEGEWLVLEVVDSGPGFPQEVIDHLFEPFVTTKPDGTGLGLIIMREACRLHGGDLSVVNRVEGGASVRARVPAR